MKQRWDLWQSGLASASRGGIPERRRKTKSGGLKDLNQRDILQESSQTHGFASEINFQALVW